MNDEATSEEVKINVRKMSKVPYTPGLLEKASVNKPETFRDYRTTVLAYAEGGYDKPPQCGKYHHGYKQQVSGNRKRCGIRYLEFAF